MIVAVIGLGNMGQGMCATLIGAGFEVWGTDIGAEQRQAAADMGVQVVDTIAQLCAVSQQFILSLPKAEHVESVIAGKDGILAHAQADTLVMDTSTSKPEVTQALAIQMQQQGHTLLDTPVSGGPAGARAGTMVMLVGGDEGALARATPVLEVLSSKWVHLGASGSGHGAKLINNLLCAAHLITTAEAVVLGKKAGLDANKLLAGINAGSGRSGVSEVNFPKWVLSDSFDSGFTMGLMRKDLGLAAEYIEANDMQLGLAQQVLAQWQASAALLADGEDFNRIVELVE